MIIGLLSFCSCNFWFVWVRFGLSSHLICDQLTKREQGILNSGSIYLQIRAWTSSKTSFPVDFSINYVVCILIVCLNYGLDLDLVSLFGIGLYNSFNRIFIRPVLCGWWVSAVEIRMFQATSIFMARFSDGFKFRKKLLCQPSKKANQSINSKVLSSVQIPEKNKASTTSSALASTTPTLPRSDHCLACSINLGMKTKIASTCSTSSSSSSMATTTTISPKPSQPDTFRYRHLKTESDYPGYLRHFGYCSRYFGYILFTATTSWVVSTLIALRQSKF